MSFKQPLQCSAIPAFADNYLWLVHDQHRAVIIDPGDAVPVLAALAAQKLELIAILLTHHHADHAGGVPALLDQFAVPVYGPAGEKIAGVTHPLQEGQSVDIAALNLQLSVIDVPGHTAGHIAYYAAAQQWLFCGDTLFAGGCGRLFEGTPAQMQHSLAKLSVLPDATQVFCAHEYTLSNLQFASAAEPGNTMLAQRLANVKAQRARGDATVPSSMAIEKATNPFLRVDQPEIVRTLTQSGRLHTPDSVATFAALREWKNSFRA